MQLRLDNTPAPRAAWTPLPAPPDISKTGFFVGTSGYHFDDWVGRFNPRKLPARRLAELSEAERRDHDRLLFYQKYFAFVEINTTFYHEPDVAHFLDIERRSKPSMRYAVKVFRDVSHTRTWDVEKGRDLMRRHVAASGPIVETGRFFSFLIQLEDRLVRSQRRLDYLLAVAEEAVRTRLDVHIEFRHVSWHEMHVLQSLKDHGIGICNTEIPPVEHAFPLKAYATTDKGYVRYSGRNVANWYPAEKQDTAKPLLSRGRPHRPSTEGERLAARNARYDYLYTDDELRERVEKQLDIGLKVSSVAVAWNNHYNIQAVHNAIANVNLLKKRLMGGQLDIEGLG